MTANGPAFIITIDTEGDDIWSRPRTVATKNAAYLPRFQALCEQHRLRPTYLVNWEMVQCSVFREFGKDVIARRAGEIGMHLHAWNNPPLTPLSADDDRYHPFLIEYPVEQMREKIAVLTAALEEAFQVQMVSHRAGRFMLDETYAQLLAEAGYRVDCSVTPHVSWTAKPGAPGGRGGVDYSRYPEAAYFVDLQCIQRAGDSPLLEAPVTIVPQRYPALVERVRARVRRVSLLRRIMHRLFPAVVWLRPNGRNRQRLLKLLADARRDGRDHIEFILHSSELMPGGSPRFSSPSSIDALYGDLEALFGAAGRDCTGLTLSEYHERFSVSATRFAASSPSRSRTGAAAAGRQS